MKQFPLLAASLSLAFPLLGSHARAEDVRAEMERVERQSRELPGLLTGQEVRPFWSTDGSSFAFKVNPAPGKTAFLQVNLQTGEKSPAFDHSALAKALAAATQQEINPDNLPIEDLKPTAQGAPVAFRALGKGWLFRPADASLVPDESPPAPTPLMHPDETRRGSRENGPATSLTIENSRSDEIEVFWVRRGGDRQSYGKVPPGQSTTLQTYAGHVWLFTSPSGQAIAGITAAPSPTIARITPNVQAPEPPRRRRGDRSGGPDTSPDAQWRASIRNHNVFIEPTAGGDATPLTTDGTPQDAYSPPFQWSPDSTKLIAWRAKPVENRKVHIVQSSPPDQLQPKLITLDYPKPGDPIHQPKPRLFDVAKKAAIPLDDALFQNPWEISYTNWAADSSEFTFLYNQRGHQVLRMVAIRGDSGTARTVIEDAQKTFVDYSQKTYLHRIPDSR